MTHHLFVRTYAVGALADRLIAEVPVRDQVEAEGIAAIQERILNADGGGMYRLAIEPVAHVELPEGSR